MIVFAVFRAVVQPGTRVRLRPERYSVASVRTLRASPGETLPDLAWALRGLCVEQSCAKAFVIHNVFVDGRSQFVAPCPLPARVFAASGLDGNLEGDVVSAGALIELEVESLATEAVEFMGNANGPAVLP